jgi:hypothetical protein
VWDLLFEVGKSRPLRELTSAIVHAGSLPVYVTEVMGSPDAQVRQAPLPVHSRSGRWVTFKYISCL